MTLSEPSERSEQAVAHGFRLNWGPVIAGAIAASALATLLRRLPNLHIDDIEHPDWRQTFVLRGLNKLPASW